MDYLFVFSSLIYPPFIALPVDPVSYRLLPRPLRSTLIRLIRVSSRILLSSFHLHHIMVDILNAPFHLLFRIMDPRSFTDTLSRRPSLVDVRCVYK